MSRSPTFHLVRLDGGREPAARQRRVVPEADTHTASKAKDQARQSLALRSCGGISASAEASEREETRFMYRCRGSPERLRYSGPCDRMATYQNRQGGITIVAAALGRREDSQAWRSGLTMSTSSRAARDIRAMGRRVRGASETARDRGGGGRGREAFSCPVRLSDAKTKENLRLTSYKPYIKR